jgi:integrase
MPKLDQLNEATIKALPVGDKNQLYFVDNAVRVQGSAVPRGFVVRVTKCGAKSFLLSYWKGPKEHRYTIGRHPDWSVLAAVREARELRQKIDRGENPMATRTAARTPVAAPQVVTVADVVERFVQQHVEKKMRRPDNYTGPFNRLVVPALGKLPIYELRRSHVADLLDKIADENGEAMADHTVACLSSALNWYSNRDDDFSPPRLRGLKRASNTGRDRILSDQEIRDLWQAAGQCGVFGHMVKFLLLTGQRRGEAAGMRWDELVEPDLWEIPAARYKTGKPHAVPLSQAATAIVENMPRISELVFPAPMNPNKAISDGGSLKTAMERHLAGAVTGWTVHDLRRTARSLMSRAGVAPDIAARVLGHAVGTAVERRYDRHSCVNEKRNALERLAQQIEDILTPPQDKVVQLRR